ncbi:TPA: hypothetical protein RUX01_002318 [Aeromonas dhakensis]|uniref:hypothetical protein n=1 Tax=Aeromonas dhakensis TaxID=196024 RepID=UPI0028D989A4|nr:hypothetical protein [Aeromonas dhakensis]
MLRILLLLFVSFGASSHEIKYSKGDGEVYVMNGEVKKSFDFDENSFGNSERWFDLFNGKPAIVNDSNSLDSFSSYATLIYHDNDFYIDCIYIDFKSNKSGLYDKTGFCGLEKKIVNGYENVESYIASFSDKISRQIGDIDTSRLISGKNNYLSIVSYRDKNTTLNKVYESKESLIAGDYEYVVISGGSCKRYRKSPWVVYNGNEKTISFETEVSRNGNIFLVGAKYEENDGSCMKFNPTKVNSRKAYIYRDGKVTTSYLIKGDFINYLYSDDRNHLCEVVYINEKNKEVNGSLLCSDINFGGK